MDIEELLAERPDNGPSGENLEFDADFMALEIAAKPGEEKQRGNEIIPAEDPDFPDVVKKAVAVLERSHDLRAGSILAGAIVQTEGLPGLAKAVAYVAGCLGRHWDSCHPQLDPDDDNDPTMRINAVRGLCEAKTVLRGLKRVNLTNSRTFGRLTLRDIQVAIGETPPGPDEMVDRAALTAAFSDSSPDFLAGQLAAARSILADITRIDRIFLARTPGQGPDLDDLRKVIQQVQRHLADASGPDEGAQASDEAALQDDDPDDAAAPVSSSYAASGRPVARGSGAPGTIEGPGDAAAALDALIAYFRRAEPSSPVPLLLMRAKRLVGADFMTIMKDMAPSGVDNVRMIGGLSDDD